jgi:hypothetical protein
MSRAAFAARYHIPIGTLRDWEQARKHPDAPALAYLRVIAKEPDMTARVLTEPRCRRASARFHRRSHKPRLRALRHTGGEAGQHTGHAGAMASSVVDAAAGGGQKGPVLI